MTFPFPYTARLVNVNPVSDSYLILEFQKPKGFEFKAGQHVTFQLKDEAGIFHRTYSIASPPSSKTRLEFCIQVQDDARSSTLFGILEKGTFVEMTSARGNFQIQDPAKTLLFIAGGSGISPLRSMIHELLNLVNPPQIYLLYGCREAKAIPFLEELGRLPIHALFFAESLESGVAAPPGPSIQVHPGRVDAGFELESNLLSKPSHFYLCGPTSMLNAIENLLLDRGITPDLIHFEHYG